MSAVTSVEKGGMAPMRMRGLLVLTAAIAALSACGNHEHDEGSGHSHTFDSGPPELSQDEIDQMNGLRSQAWFFGGSVVQNATAYPSLNTTAIRHAGFLSRAQPADYTTISTATIAGQEETNFSVPLATPVNTGFPADPPNRIRMKSAEAGDLPPLPLAEHYKSVEHYQNRSAAYDTFASGGYVPDANGLPSRPLTMWYSVVGRARLMRHDLHVFGFGSVSQAHLLDERVLYNNQIVFSGGKFRFCWELLYSSNILTNKKGVWPNATTHGNQQQVYQLSTDDNGTGCPIHVADANTIDSVNIDLLEKYDPVSGYGWGPAGGPPATPHAFIGYFHKTAADDPGGTIPGKWTAGAASHAVIDSDVPKIELRPSECFVAPKTPLPVGEYRITLTVQPAGWTVTTYFEIIPVP
jgi:hypothetical protein